jgi:hypothetical protein
MTSLSESGSETMPPRGVRNAADPTYEPQQRDERGSSRIADAYGGSAPAAIFDTDGREEEDTAHNALIAQEDGTAPAPIAEDWPEQIDPAALHGLAGDIVHAIEPHTEADPVALLVQILVGFGSMIGAKSRYEIEGAQHPARINAILVGVSSKGRKGTSWRQVEQFLREADEQWVADQVVEGLSSGEGLIWAVRDAIEREEPIREGGKRTGKVTGYETVTVDPGISDKRLLVMEGEFASVLRALGREGNTLSPILRRAWDNGDLRTLVKNSPAKATGAHISIVGHITRDELLRYLSSSEQGNGFANRFLWFVVRRSKVLPEGGGAVAVGNLIHRLTEASDFWKGVERVLGFDGRARQMWHAVYPKLSQGKPGLLGAVTGRAEAYVMRLAVAYALLDCCSEIRSAHLEAALALWEYSERSAAWIFGTATGDATADRIIEALKSAQNYTMTRDQVREVFGNHAKSERISRALAVLVAADQVTIESVKTGGRPAECIHLTVRDKRGMCGKGKDTAHSAQPERG